MLGMQRWSSIFPIYFSRKSNLSGNYIRSLLHSSCTFVSSFACNFRGIFNIAGLKFVLSSAIISAVLSPVQFSLTNSNCFINVWSLWQFVTAQRIHLSWLKNTTVYRGMTSDVNYHGASYHCNEDKSLSGGRACVPHASSRMQLRYNLRRWSLLLGPSLTFGKRAELEGKFGRKYSVRKRLVKESRLSLKLPRSSEKMVRDREHFARNKITVAPLTFASRVHSSSSSPFSLLPACWRKRAVFPKHRTDPSRHFPSL